MSLNNMKGEACVIVGTLYKHQELKPSVLQEVSKQVRFSREYAIPNCVQNVIF